VAWSKDGIAGGLRDEKRAKKAERSQRKRENKWEKKSMDDNSFSQASTNSLFFIISLHVLIMAAFIYHFV
jgi:hypothetical protein